MSHLDSAERLLREAAESGERTLGPDHPDLGIILRNLASILIGKGEYAGAESLLRRASMIFDERYPADHPRRITAGTAWGRCLLKLDRKEEAEAALLKLVRSRPSDSKVEGPWADAVTALVELYNTTNQPEKADQWKPLLKRSTSAEKPRQ